MDLYAKKSGLGITRPGYFKSLDLALPYFKSEGMTHLALDEGNIARRPYLKEVFLAKCRGLFVEKYSDYGTEEKWKMRIFEIDWDNNFNSLK